MGTEMLPLRFAQGFGYCARMTGLDFSVGEELSSSFEPCLKDMFVQGDLPSLSSLLDGRVFKSQK
jgi:hypothetical protein